MERIIMLYLIWNLLTFCLMGMDKQWARAHHRRIPERRFFVMALFFGALGILMGMGIFHHKTRHLTFLWGIPLLFGINLFLMYVLYQAFLSA